MEITKEQYGRLKPYLPIQRGNVKINNLVLINAILYIAENGCKWRGLPKEYGKWYSIYKRVNRWAKSGVLERIFLGLQKEQIASINVEILALDSTCFKVHPDGTGVLKQTEKSLGNMIQSYTNDVMSLKDYSGKGVQEGFTRYDKLDTIFLGFIYFSLSIIALN